MTRERRGNPSCPIWCQVARDSGSSGRHCNQGVLASTSREGSAKTACQQAVTPFCIRTCGRHSGRFVEFTNKMLLGALFRGVFWRLIRYGAVHESNADPRRSIARPLSVVLAVPGTDAARQPGTEQTRSVGCRAANAARSPRQAAPISGQRRCARGLAAQGVANNLRDALRAFRRDKRDLAREQSLEAAIEQSSVRMASVLAADQSSPSRIASRRENLLRMADALLELPEAQREAVVLHHLQGWPLSEVASHLQRTEPAVAGLLHRGLKQLRKLMAVSE